jgi:phosphoglycerol transferase MdoB-like AlkP superfamily enzyme
LIRESWYFPNHFSAAGRGTTSDTEFTVNTSLYPPVEGAASLMYADRQFTSIPRLLSEYGYRALTFHTNSVSYWNRSQLYPALGFDRYYDDRYFGSAEKIAFGASDRVLFSKTLEELLREDAPGNPFYAQVVTMSSHFPFTGVPTEDRKIHFTEEYAGTIEGDYLTEIKYADAELGKFVQGLRESGLLERSVLVIHGDHFGLPMPRNQKEKAALELLLGHEYTPVDKLNTPLLVRLPGQVEARRVTSPAGHVDLMPTLADALGVSMANVPHFGRSIFREGPILFSAGGLLPPGSFVDERVLYIAGGGPESGEVWDISTRERVPVSPAHADRLEGTRQLLRESDAYVRHLPLRADFDPEAERILPTP